MRGALRHLFAAATLLLVATAHAQSGPVTRHFGLGTGSALQTCLVADSATDTQLGAAVRACYSGVPAGQRYTLKLQGIKPAPPPVEPPPPPPPPVEPPPPPPPVGEWVAVANEGQSFTAASPVQARFGTGSSWTQRQVSGTIVCGAAAFGGVDPAPGVGKRCETAAGGVPPVEPPPPPPPTGPGPVTPPPAGATVLHFSDCQAGASAACTAGANSNSGAADAPKRDLAGVNLNALAAGTTLRFHRGGAWAVSRVDIENNNVSAAAPLTFEAYGVGPRPLMRSTGNAVGWQFGGGWGNSTNDGGYVLRGLELRGTGSTAGDHWGIWLVQNVRDILLDDVVITNFGLGIHASGGSPYGVTRLTVRGGSISRNLSMGFLGTVSDSLFEGTLYEANNFSGSPMSHAIYASGGNRNVIRGNRFLNNSVVNGLCRGGNYTVHGNIDGLLIEGNTIEVPAADWSCGGYNVTAGYDYTEAFRNVVVRGNAGVNLGQCLVCINSAPGALIEGNRAFSRSANAAPLTLAHGFMQSETPMTGVIVRDNTICGSGSISSISGATVTGGRVLPATDPGCTR